MRNNYSKNFKKYNSLTLKYLRLLMKILLIKNVEHFPQNVAQTGRWKGYEL